MMSFKKFLTEVIPSLPYSEYYSDYSEMRTSRKMIKLFKERMASKFSLPLYRFSIIPMLMHGEPLFRFKFVIKLTKKEDPQLVGKLLQNFAKKDLEQNYENVHQTSEFDVNDPDGPHPSIMFSIYTSRNQTLNKT